MKTTAPFYAVYQDGYAVFGVGATPEEALADARRWADDGHLELSDPDHLFDGAMIMVPCSAAVYDAVLRDGGLIDVERDEDGTLVLAD